MCPVIVINIYYHAVDLYSAVNGHSESKGAFVLVDCFYCIYCFHHKVTE